MDLLKHWPIADGILSVESLPSYWGKASLVSAADGKAYVLKPRTSTEDIRREHILLSHLQTCGVPVAVPLMTRTAIPHAEHEGKVFALYPRLQGTSFSDHYSRGGETRSSMFGAAIALLHSGLKTFPEQGLFPTLDLVEHVTGWAIPEIAHHSASVDSDRIRRVAELFEASLRPCYEVLPKQMIHRDPNPSNIFFFNGTLSAWLDFDMVTRSARIFDPCYCATSILVGGWESPEKREAWPKLLAAVLGAYAKGHLVTETEMRAVFPVLLAIQFMFMAFSLSQKQVSAGQCNESILYWLVDNHKEIQRQTEGASNQQMHVTASCRP